MMFAMVLPLPRTSASLSAGVGCFLAHTGSASIASGLSLGGVPSKVTVPVTVPAAETAAGHHAAAASAVARHNAFNILLMLVRFVISNFASLITLRGFAPQTPLHRRSLAASPARAAQVVRFA